MIRCRSSCFVVVVLAILLVLLNIPAPLHNPIERSQGERDQWTLVASQYAFYAQSNDQGIPHLDILFQEHKSVVCLILLKRYHFARPHIH